MSNLVDDYDQADGLDAIYDNAPGMLSSRYYGFRVSAVEYTGAPHKDSVTVAGVLNGNPVTLEFLDDSGAVSTYFSAPAVQHFGPLEYNMDAREFVSLEQFSKAMEARMIAFANIIAHTRGRFF